MIALRPRPIGLLLVLLILAGLSGRTPAQQGKGGLSVSLVYPPDAPARNYFQYQLPPGQSRADAIDLQNTSSEPLQVRIYAADGFATSDGALTGPLFGETSKGAGRWVSLDNAELLLNPGQTRRVHFKIAIPTEAPTGDHFAFVFVEPTAAPSANAGNKTGKDRPVQFQVVIAQRIGICLWERVPGQVQSGFQFTGIKKVIDRGRLVLELEVQNTGNTYVKPTGKWALKGPSGETLASAPAQEWGYLLPGTPMKLRIPLATSRPLVRGEYTVEVSAQFDNLKAQETYKLNLP